MEADVDHDGRGNQDPAVWCACGSMILAAIGDDFVLTTEMEQRWMRRRFDTVNCSSCSRHYGLADLRELSTPDRASEAFAC